MLKLQVYIKLTLSRSSRIVLDLCCLSVNLMTSQTTVNWTSLYELVNSCSLILAHTAIALLPRI